MFRFLKTLDPYGAPISINSPYPAISIEYNDFIDNIGGCSRGVVMNNVQLLRIESMFFSNKVYKIKDTFPGTPVVAVDAADLK